MSHTARMISSSRSLMARAQARPPPPSSSARCASARPASSAAAKTGRLRRGGTRLRRVLVPDAPSLELRLDRVAVEQVSGGAAAAPRARAAGGGQDSHRPPPPGAARRLASIASQIAAARSGPPSRCTARMPVGEVTLISVSQPSITSMPTKTRPRRFNSGPMRAQIARSRAVSSVQPPRRRAPCSSGCRRRRARG